MQPEKSQRGLHGAHLHPRRRQLREHGIAVPHGKNRRAKAYVTRKIGRKMPRRSMPLPRNSRASVKAADSFMSSFLSPSVSMIVWKLIGAAMKSHEIASDQG
jgi:hypothetical protein